LKTFFFSIFTLLVAGLAFGAAIGLRDLLPRELRNGGPQDFAQDTAEKVLAAAGHIQGLESFTEKFEAHLGICRLYSMPKPGAVDALKNITPAPQMAVPFSRPIRLQNATLLCHFPGGGKSILLIPNPSTTLSLRRRAEQSGIINFISGNFRLKSDELNLFIYLPTLKIHFRTKEPVVLSFAEDPDLLRIKVVSGNLDVTYEARLEATQLAITPRFDLAPGTTLSTQDKPLASEGTVMLLPSGFEAHAAAKNGSAALAPPPTSPAKGPAH